MGKLEMHAKAPIDILWELVTLIENGCAHPGLVLKYNKTGTWNWNLERLFLRRAEFHQTNAAMAYFTAFQTK